MNYLMGFIHAIRALHRRHWVTYEDGHSVCSCGWTTRSEGTTMKKLRGTARALAFTLAPCITDAEGLKLTVLIVVVGIAAIAGWGEGK